MRVVTLASGSSGNATLVEAGNTALLVDAGVSARILAARLKQAGRSPGDLAGIVLTHEHSDHIAGALTLARQYDLPIWGDARTLAALQKTAAYVVPTPEDDPARPVALEKRPVGSSWQIAALAITSFAIPHDAVAPCGYLISSGAWKVCVVTDCGEMDNTILTHIRQAHLVILEANHDKTRLLRGPYPQSLKRRILSPTGHLANDQAAETIANCASDDPRWVWLAHLSRTNNTPDLAHTAVTGRLGGRRLRATQVAVAPPGFGLVWDSAHLLTGAPA